MLNEPEGPDNHRYGIFGLYDCRPYRQQYHIQSDRRGDKKLATFRNRANTGK